ncbi:BA14K family protein [Roseibium sp.]|uniref:BA14K family protein n=1 Tax=Roseibium sp. TaxID=1936156 RepID=UPI003A9882CB
MTFNDIMIGAVAVVGIALTSITGAKSAPLPLANLTIGAQAPIDLTPIKDPRRGFYRHNDSYWYNGHRGERHPRRGWRQHRGYWFPPAAFTFSFGTPPRRYAPPPRYSRALPVEHYQWCDNRYRSYRARDNTFQPYNGPRRQCRSPYAR